MQEIISVSIKGDKDVNNPLFKGTKKVYVNFVHGNEEDRRSLDLRKPQEWKSNLILEGLVNMHIKVDKDRLFCQIKEQKGRAPSDRDPVLATAEFTANELQLSEKEGKFHTVVRRPNGDSMPNLLEIAVVQKNWEQMYADLDEPKEGKLDPFFRLMSRFFSATLESTHNKRSHELSKPVAAADPNLTMSVPMNGLTKFPKTDEFEPVSPIMLIVFKALNGFVPLADIVTAYKNRAEGIYDIRQVLKNNVATPNEGRWVYPTSDAAMKRVFFSSIGSFFVKKLPGFEAGYVADLTNLCKYKHLDGEVPYENYGCKTFFNENGDVVKVEQQDGTSYFPGDQYWEWAKLKSRTSAFVMAAYLHLAELHYCWGNIAGASLRMYLPPDHPIRMAFTVHFYKTHHTCSRAEQSLFNERGLLSRGLSTKYEGGLERVLHDMIGGFQFKRYPDEMKEKDLVGCKFHVGANDGLDLHKIFSDYVCEVFDEVYPDEAALDADVDMKRVYNHLVENIQGFPEAYTLENVKMVWGEIIFRVTGFHSSGKLNHTLL